jgi:hypothetical protein
MVGYDHFDADAPQRMTTLWWNWEIEAGGFPLISLLFLQCDVRRSTSATNNLCDDSSEGEALETTVSGLGGRCSAVHLLIVGCFSS